MAKSVFSFFSGAGLLDLGFENANYNIVFVNEFNQHFDLEYCPTKDLLEAGKYIAGAKCVIGNQSGLFSLAECMKVPRILCSAEYFRYNNQYIPGPVNVHPQGGWNEVAAITEKLKTTVQTLLT